MYGECDRAWSQKTFMGMAFYSTCGRNVQVVLFALHFSKGKERSAFMREVYNSEEVIRRRLRDIDDLAKSVR